MNICYFTATIIFAECEKEIQCYWSVLEIAGKLPEVCVSLWYAYDIIIVTT